jgi:TonB family protein
VKRLPWFLVALATSSFAADTHTYSGDALIQLKSYCADVRTGSDLDVVDPTALVEGVTYVQPRPTEILGQRVKAASRRLGLGGKVTLGLIISAQGKARAAQVIESSGHTRLDDEGIAIMNTAEYSPARVNGRNSAACWTVRVVFEWK